MKRIGIIALVLLLFQNQIIALAYDPFNAAIEAPESTLGPETSTAIFVSIVALEVIIFSLKHRYIQRLEKSQGVAPTIKSNRLNSNKLSE